MKYLLKLVFTRPVITVFVVYFVSLIVLNWLGYFSLQSRSNIFKLFKDSVNVLVEGKVVSAPYVSDNAKKFILKTSSINHIEVKEQILVSMPVGYVINYGDIITVEGKLYRPVSSKNSNLFDYQKYLERNEIFFALRVYSFEYIRSQSNIIKKIAIDLKGDIVNKIDDYFLYPSSAILKSLIIGDKTSLDQKIKSIFSDSGVIHILVVSGLHVGLVSLIILFVLKLFCIPLNKASLISTPFIFFYVISTGGNPPAVRAAIMLTCIFISLALDREPLIYNSIVLSALIILIFKPQALFLASFQMSYLATGGIVFLYNKVFKLFKSVKNSVLSFFCGVASVTVSAQLALMPVLMFYFSKLSIVSFFANIIVVPITGVVLGCAIVFYISTFLSKHLAMFFAYILNIFVSFIMYVTTFLGSLQFSSIVVNRPSILELLLFYMFLFLVFTFKNKSRIIFSSIVLSLNFLLV
ncbi:MAG: ComEC family competence protein [Endomicrobium sp.]|jgi:competence protein ComEC|nr:ComEC family competence protein [Endomicrobium sp.]